MSDKLRDYMSRDWPKMTDRELTNDGTELFSAWLVDLPGCIAQGDTKEQAIERLEALKPAYFAKLVEHGVEPPEPSKEAAVGTKYFGFYDPQTGAMFALKPARRLPADGAPPTESVSLHAAVPA